MSKMLRMDDLLLEEELYSLSDWLSDRYSVSRTGVMGSMFRLVRP